MRNTFKIGALLGACAVLLPGAGGTVSAPVSPEAGLVTNATGAYLAGRYAQAIDDWPAAAYFLRQALSYDAGNDALLQTAYRLSLGSGEIDNALKLARQLAAAGRPPHMAVALLVADDLANGHLDKARQDLATATADDGLGKYVVPLMQAWLDMAEKRPADAIAALKPLATAQGFRPLHDLQAGLIEELAGDRAAAEPYYEQAAHQASAYRVVQLVGGFYQRAGKPDQARHLYDAFKATGADELLLAPLYAALDAHATPAQEIANANDGLAEALFDLGSALHQEGANELALLYGRIALHLKPGLGLARLMVGDVLATHRQAQAAIGEYRLVGGGVALSWMARLRIVDELAQLKRLDEATGLLEAMAKEQPRRVDALTELGDLYRNAGKLGPAIDAYDRAVQRLGTPSARDWALFYARGMALQQAKQWPRAEADLKTALKLSPDQPYVLNYLGYSWVDLGVNLVQARQMIEHAVALKPNDGYIVDSLGWALYRSGDYAGAVRQLEHAVELKPLDPTINDHLGDAYWQVGRRAEAQFQWQRALHDAEDDQQAAAIRQKLDGNPPRRQTAETRPISDKTSTPPVVK